MHDLMLFCFRSLISTQNFQRALTASVNSSHGDKECPFSGVTNSDRVWRKVPESDARSVLIISLAETEISGDEPHLCRTEKDPWLMR